VRPARRSEAPWLAANNEALALETEGLALDPAAAARGAARVFQGDVGARYLIAEIAGEPVGQCLVTTEWSDWRDAPVWWIQSVYVRPDARRRGVWRALYDAVRGLARAAGAPMVRLYVDRTNRAAIDVYRASGMDGDHYLVFEQAP
jgi:GNAT superfamily N-acetyltransferase